MSRPRLRQVALVGVAGGAGLLGAYLRIIRPWMLRWGATDEEIGRPLPGDRLITRPGFKATRAITIAARPEYVWPWLVQLGSGRAGWMLDPLDDRRPGFCAACRRRIRRCGRGKCCMPWFASTGDIVMVRKQLRGIRARAERLARAAPDPHSPVPVTVPS
jgi:hypothetical protein